MTTTDKLRAMLLDEFPSLAEVDLSDFPPDTDGVDMPENVLSVWGELSDEAKLAAFLAAEGSQFMRGHYWGE